MSLSTGIVGLPNVGKSTLFNAFTRGSAPASNYPFCTIDPNVAVVEVPDGRLQRLAALLQPASVTPTAIRFTDIAGLVRGASRGEGRGNRFLADVRQADALLHVVRCFADDRVTHVEGSLDPVRDADVVDTELVLADLEVVERNLPTLEKAVRSDPRSTRRAEVEALQLVGDVLAAGRPAREAGLAPGQEQAVRGYNFLTAKPVLVVANVSEGDAAAGGPGADALRARYGRDRVLAVSAQIEAEIAQLSDADDTAAFLSDLGLAESGVHRLIRAAYRLLDLLTFYTLANHKLQAWQLRRGTKAPAAAGHIHSDMEEGFIRAEVASAEDLERAAGHLARLREEGRLRHEGHDYVVQDGDVITFLFKS